MLFRHELNLSFIGYKPLYEKDKMLVTKVVKTFAQYLFLSSENPFNLAESKILRVNTSFLAQLFLEKSQCIAIISVTFPNISVIIADIYLKLGACVHYPKSNRYYQGRQSKMIFFQ